LRILTALASEPRQEFVRLRNLTRLTDGNLSTHARRLATGGLVAIHKSIQNGKPVTRLELTPTGREALESHAHGVLAALNTQSSSETTREPEESIDAVDEWVD
jgi:DNA-binding MarR family transcriptional regulator